MRLKIWCDGESEKSLQNFLQLNKASDSEPTLILCMPLLWGENMQRTPMN